ncbi:MAG: aconitase X catalytic domain-containing protein [Deltaproteobacteria bacterium]|nr:aconitase X catalytic domain-containing protein [Deltaproteobacteria bacterium]
MLDGADQRRGARIIQRMMRLLVRLGDIYGAERMMEIGSAQISGVSFKSIGDPGLEFLEDLAAAGVKVAVASTINPAGMDLEDWRTLGFAPEFAARQERIVAAFRALGLMVTATCTPYLVGNLPRFGEHLAWAESSAVSFANSVIGARTNREGGPSALAAAICGCTPDYGLHRDENRAPTVRVRVSAAPATQADFGALGYLVGQRVRDGIPLFSTLPLAGVDELKALGAAMAASGAVALYHIEGVTPEAARYGGRTLDGFEVTAQDLDAVRAELTTGASADWLVLGCPHASIKELAEIARKLAGRTVRKRLWVCTSRTVKQLATASGLVQVIEEAGGRVVADTCMVVAPIEAMGQGTMAVDSGKAAAYLPGFCGQRVVFLGRDEIIEEACR